jgi:peptide deformylase
LVQKTGLKGETMALRHILRIDNPQEQQILKTRSQPVTLPNPKLPQLIEDMFETMHAANGVGLAAPQIGLLQRLAVIGIKRDDQAEDGPENEDRYVLINPSIVKISPERERIMDGCLSLPGWYGQVERATWVTVDYYDLKGKKQRIRKATGLLAWALQHEIDHLNGVLFTEHLLDINSLRYYGSDEEDV